MTKTLLPVLFLALSVPATACDALSGGRPPQSPADVEDHQVPDCMADHTCGI